MQKMIRQDNIKIADPFLLRILEDRRGQTEIGNILRTIQAEQNEIVDFDFGKNLLVQGCAGSGKTMILFHRLANIQYNIEEHNLDLRKVAVIVPNSNFRKSIESLTVELEIDKRVRILTMDEYLLEKTEESLLKIFGRREADSTTGHKAKDKKDEMKQKINDQIRSSFSKESTKASRLAERAFDSEGMKKFIQEYQETRKELFRERELRKRDRENNDVSNRSAYVKWRHKSLAEIRSHRKRSLDEFFARFLGENYGRGYIISMLRVLCDGELSEFRPNADQLLMIDEGQDYGLEEYSLLKAISPKGVFNVFGDIDQRIHERGLDDWTEVRQMLSARYFTLDQNYRNSVQIVDFVNETFDKQILSVGLSIKNVEFIEMGKLAVYLDYERELLGHHIAIITETPERYRVEVPEIQVLTVEQAKGLEFDAVFVSPEVTKATKNRQYVAFTRALSDLYIIR